MDHYAGIDVSLECSSVCVVDGSGKIVREGKVASEPEALMRLGWFRPVHCKSLAADVIPRGHFLSFRAPPVQ
jgi:hypothetical protein